MDIEKLVVLAKQVAKPWAIVSYVLAALLAISIAGNVYQATQSANIIIDQDNSYSNYNNNGIEK